MADRVLITAFHYDRHYSMESRLAWHRAQAASSDFDVTVICASADSSEPLRSATFAERRRDGRVSVVVIPLLRLERMLMSASLTFYAGYRLWHGRVYRLAKHLHAKRPFALVHHLSFCGYREPSQVWQLGVPFVWGPVGGTQPFPSQFLGQIDAAGAMRELARNLLNYWQLTYGRRVRAAVRSADHVWAANREVAQHLFAGYHRVATVQLETGIARIAKSSRPPRDSSRPLRILWAGRLRSWKALPLFLRALAGLPPDCPYVLRVLGQGNCLGRWQRLANKLGIADRVEWVGWPAYHEQLPHYDWADVFAFTSLRDTSGTGLLESLAAGAPVIALDHQGAGDIVTDECGVRVPATTPRAAIEGFRDAIVKLAKDNDLLQAISSGAIQRAEQFLWTRQWAAMRHIYRQAAHGAAVDKDVERTPVASEGRQTDHATAGVGISAADALPLSLCPT